MCKLPDKYSGNVRLLGLSRVVSLRRGLLGYLYTIVEILKGYTYILLILLVFMRLLDLVHIRFLILFYFRLVVSEYRVLEII